jgi:hypothetical protein
VKRVLVIAVLVPVVAAFYLPQTKTSPLLTSGHAA